MAKVHKRRNDYATQAALDALVRFGPETSGLNALLRQAYEDRSTGRQQATGTARSVVNAVDAARPQVRKIYNDAGLQGAQTAKTLIGKDLQGLSGAADSIVAGSALEQAGAANRLGEAEASALTGLSQQRVAARQGRQFALGNVQRQFVSDVAKVLARRQDLAREQGAFAASEVGKLRQADLDRQTRLDISGAGRQQSERNSLRSAGIDPDTGKPIPNGRLDPAAKPAKKPQKIAPGQQMSLNDDVQSALTLLASDVDPDKSHGRHQSGKSLITGEPAVKGKDKNGTTQTLVDAIPKHQALAVRVANDMYYDGHLSPATIKLLRRNHVNIKAIPGVKIWTPQQRAEQRRKRKQRNPFVGAIGQGVGALGG